MRTRWLVAAALVVSVTASGQQTATLRVRVTLDAAGGPPTPIARHALLISDNPATGAPKLVRTAADGTVEVTLPPGSYAVESERAVMFEGQGYEWFQYLDLAADQEVVLDLTRANASSADPLPALAESDDDRPATDPVLVVGRWRDSVVSVWSPTARASGVIVDARGLIATDRKAIGSATTVAVQVSASLKVPARVLLADPTRDIALLWVSPDATADRPPVALACTSATPSAMSPGDELLAITSEIGRPIDLTWGKVISPGPPRLATDFRMSKAGAGAPVFDAAGTVIGLTTTRTDPDSPRWHEVEVVPVTRLCEALDAARPAVAGTTPPEPTPLPVEQTRPFPVAEVDPKASTAAAAPPAVITSDHFEIAFVTPADLHRGGQKADWTGGRNARTPEVEARLGRLTDFGGWSDYFLDPPAAVIVRATPRMVEGFWKRVAREAARTQGAELPPFKSFKSSFARLTLRCGTTTILPVQPFVLDHEVSDSKVIREGLYVFAPDAFDPACNDLRLDLYTEQTPETADTIPVAPDVVRRLQDDFAAWRALP